MRTVFYMLLIYQVEYAENFVIINAAVGENVTLSCKRHATGSVGFLFWIRLVHGNMPEILGKTYTFDDKSLDTNSRIATKQEPGTFVLHFAGTMLDDTAFYFCLKSQQINIAFLNGTFLRITGPEPDVTTITQDPLFDTVHEGVPLSLQCSVLSHSEKKSCPEKRRVFWYRVSSAHSHPSLIYAQNEGDGKCENNSQTQPGQSCVFNFVKNISFTDTGTYYCALAACGKVIFGNGTKLEFEDISIINSQKNNTVLLLLSGGLILTLIVSALLVCLIWKRSCECCKGPGFLGRNAEAVYGQQQNQQKSEDSLVYSAVISTQTRADRAGRVKTRRKEGTIYSDVRIFDKD